MTESAVAPSSGAVVASPAQIRAAFPALERMHRGQPVAYFDGPGGTQVPRAVVAAMEDYLYHHNANTHWRYPTSEETDALIAGARATLADFLGATPAEIAFGANMTTLTFHLARALGRQWGPGDTVVITELDHHANVAPWRALERERGVTIRSVPLIPDTGRLDWSEARGVAVGGSPAAGDRRGVQCPGDDQRCDPGAALARAAGALTFVDAVHFAPHEPVDVTKIGCDFLACSAYKFYGPHIGVMFARNAVLQSLDVPKLAPAPETVPERLETGTLNHEGIVGAAAAVEFLASLGSGPTRRSRLARVLAELHARGQTLVERLWTGLEGGLGAWLYGLAPGSPRTPTVAFTVAGRSPDEVAERLAQRAVFVSSGDFYATTVVERLGLKDGLVRAGCACYTTEEEVSRLVEGVRELSS